METQSGITLLDGVNFTVGAGASFRIFVPGVLPPVEGQSRFVPQDGEVVGFQSQVSQLEASDLGHRFAVEKNISAVSLQWFEGQER